MSGGSARPGLLRRADELDGVGHDLDLGAALAVPGGPLRQAQFADHGDLSAPGEVLGAGGGQLVEADDVDEVGAVGAGAGDGEALLRSPGNLWFRWG